MQDMFDIAKAVTSVNKENSIKVRLYHDTRTTPIMDEFYHSDKDFLVFERAFTIGKNWTTVSLIVSKRIPINVSVLDNGMTMTDLKKYIGMVVTDSYFENMKETRRLYPLFKELIGVSKSTSESETRVGFECPVRLGGQTYDDQTGFGSEYHGSYEVIHGKQYGETTGFFVIGIMTD